MIGPTKKSQKHQMYLVVLTGRLHGVGFRYAVSRYAREHKLVGTVRNIPDGVEIIINDKDFLNNFDSPIFSRVETKTIDEINVVGAKYTDFSVVDSRY